MVSKRGVAHQYPNNVFLFVCLFFFSRLASRQRTRGQDAIPKEKGFDITADENDDIDTLIGDSDRNNLLDDIQSRIGL